MYYDISGVNASFFAFKYDSFLTLIDFNTLHVSKGSLVLLFEACIKGKKLF